LAQVSKSVVCSTSNAPYFRFAAMMKITALLCALANGMELDKSTWDAAVAGKTVFVKFQAPW